MMLIMLLYLFRCLRGRSPAVSNRGVQTLGIVWIVTIALATLLGDLGVPDRVTAAMIEIESNTFFARTEPLQRQLVACLRRELARNGHRIVTRVPDPRPLGSWQMLVSLGRTPFTHPSDIPVAEAVDAAFGWTTEPPIYYVALHPGIPGGLHRFGRYARPLADYGKLQTEGILARYLRAMRPDHWDNVDVPGLAVYASLGSRPRVQTLCRELNRRFMQDVVGPVDGELRRIQGGRW